MEKFSLQDLENQRIEERRKDQKWREGLEADMLKDVRTSMDLSEADTLASSLSKVSPAASSDAARQFDENSNSLAGVDIEPATHEQKTR